MSLSHCPWVWLPDSALILIVREYRVSGRVSCIDAWCGEAIWWSVRDDFEANEERNRDKGCPVPWHSVDGCAVLLSACEDGDSCLVLRFEVSVAVVVGS